MPHIYMFLFLFSVGIVVPGADLLNLSYLLLLPPMDLMKIMGRAHDMTTVLVCLRQSFKHSPTLCRSRAC